MQFLSKCAKLSAAFALAAIAVPGITPAQHYTQTNLVSDPSESVGKAPVHDPNLLNPWGLTRSSGSPWWVGNNNSGTSTLYAIVPPPPTAKPGPPPPAAPQTSSRILIPIPTVT